jgi:hypothetical protein
MIQEEAGAQSQYSGQSGAGGDQGGLGMPEVVQLLGGAELVPNPLLVEQTRLELGRFAGGSK